MAQIIREIQANEYNSLVHCAQRQNSKTINRIKKIKQSLNSEKNTLWNKKKSSSRCQIMSVEACLQNEIKQDICGFDRR